MTRDPRSNGAAQTLECRICGNADGNVRHFLDEMMYGTGESFEYFECRACGCLQIATIPADLGAHYPAGYYSHSIPQHAGAGLRRFLKRQRGIAAFQGRGVLGNLLLRAFGPPAIARSLAPLRPRLDLRILDVGAGSGRLLLDLADFGFRDLTGIDPFIERTVEYASGVRVLKQTVQDTAPGFDVVMFHHSFEHLPDPHDTLRHVRRILRPNGTVLLRVPVTGTHAWREFGRHWIQLDPPRHLYLYTPHSMRTLAGQCGFELVEITYDSEAFQFWGSVQAQRGVPLQSPRSYATNPRTAAFTAGEIRAFRRKARELNARQDGDQVCFYLRAAGAEAVKAARSS